MILKPRHITTDQPYSRYHKRGIFTTLGMLLNPPPIIY